MTIIERLRTEIDTASDRPDYAVLDNDNGYLTYGDARALLAHYDAMSALYAHVKYRPEGSGAAFHEWVATWKKLNDAEVKAYHALTVPEPTP